MYTISYEMFTGTMLHRASSARAALDVIELVRSGGGQVLKVVLTASGREVSIAELQLLAVGMMSNNDARPPIRRQRLFRPTRGYR